MRFLISICILILGTGCEFADFVNSRPEALNLANVTITDLPDGNLVNSSNQSNYRVRGACDIVGISINFSLGVGTALCDGSSYDATLDLSGEPEGTLSIIASMQDSDGNTVTSSPVSVTKNIIVPTVLTYRTTSSNEAVSLPLAGGFDYNLSVDWGDGSPEVAVTSATDVDRSHIFSSPGEYDVTLVGAAEAIRSNCSAGSNRLIEAHLNDLGLINLHRAFYFCTNLLDVTIDDTSSVTDMSEMFNRAFNSTPLTDNWDTSNVTDMGGMFWLARAATPNTLNWDTSNVTDMSYMFQEADLADPETGMWDTSSVTDMNGMFYLALNADPDVSSWNTSSVTNMYRMFREADQANPDVSNWDVSSVTNIGDMFRYTDLANPDVRNWDVSNVTDMSYMFDHTLVADPDVSNWDVSNVVNIEYMFASSIADPEVETWTTSSLENIRGVFLNNPVANPDVSGWDTSNVTRMELSFYNATSASPDVSGWVTNNVVDMSSMFEGASVANPNVSLWNFSSHVSGDVLDNIFRNSNIDNMNYSNFLIALDNTRPAAQPVDIGPIPAQYNSSAAAARANLLSAGYTLSDNGAE